MKPILFRQLSYGLKGKSILQMYIHHRRFINICSDNFIILFKMYYSVLIKQFSLSVCLSTCLYFFSGNNTTYKFQHLIFHILGKTVNKFKPVVEWMRFRSRQQFIECITYID